VSSTGSSASVKVGKVRKPADSVDGGESEDSIKRQKRIQALDGNKSQAKLSSGMFIYKYHLNVCDV